MSKISRAFGAIIRRRRELVGISQEKLAELADIHRTYVSSIELGKVTVGIGVCYKIAKALNIPLSKIIQEVERKL